MSDPTAPLKSMLDNGVDVDARRVFLHGDVDESTIGAATKSLLWLDAVDPHAPIELVVSSCGGDVWEMWGLHDVMRWIQSPVETVAMGKCLSAAPLLVAAGNRGSRGALPHTRFLIHEGYAGIRGDRAKMAEADLQEHHATEGDWLRAMARYTKRGVRFWRDINARVEDTWISTDEAQAWGIIDYVWSIR